ncbi:MAG TPA: LysM peptidoglycan-binding domain-containing protein, partial [Rhodocyclaceae bacterium]|nr:LysM peptidoglycan-binding domain-containing protein [Rhodocyclaceae bacterium]
MWRYFFIMLFITLAGCGSRPPAPVSDRGTPVIIERGLATGAPAVAREGYYIVKKGDTLRRIALEHGHDYRDIAAWNNMTDP